jgi:hypothetical protein
LFSNRSIMVALTFFPILIISLIFKSFKFSSKRIFKGSFAIRLSGTDKTYSFSELRFSKTDGFEVTNLINWSLVISLSEGAIGESHLQRLCYGFQPTEFSISISINLFISTAYSRGNSRTIGLINPFTIIASACSFGIPREVR